MPPEQELVLCSRKIRFPYTHDLAKLATLLPSEPLLNEMIEDLAQF